MGASVGIVGFGRIGAEHARWIHAAGLTVGGVFDPTAERRLLAEAAGLPTFVSLGALLSSDIDSVLIATPTSMHAAAAMHALDAGKHTMIEKPMTLDAASARSLIDRAARNGLRLSVFHNRRFDADYLTLKRAIDANAFGRVFNIESRLGQWASCVGPAAREFRPGWRNEAAYGGGGLLDWGSHFLDQLWRLLAPQKPVRVFAQLRGNVWTSDCDDFARVTLDFDGGSVAVCEINTTTTMPLPRWHVDGEHGSASSPHSPTFDLSTWSDFTFTPHDGEPRRLDRATSDVTESTVWQRFAAGESLVPATSVLPTMLLLDAARESNRRGEAVSLAPEAFIGLL